MESSKSNLNRFFTCSAIASAGLSIILISIISQTQSLWTVRSSQHLQTIWSGVLLGLLIYIGARFTKERGGPKLVMDPRGFVVGLVVLFTIDWFTRGYSFLPGPEIRGELLLLFFLIFAFFKYIRKERFVIWGSFLCCLLLFSGFLSYARGRLLFSDDHPVFLYRLILLREHFPDIPVYNPLWSMGRDTLHIFATGNLNIFLLFYPLVSFFNPLSVYTWLVAILLFLLTPGCMWLGARILGFSKVSAAIASLLSVSASALWYQWSLKYGTLGCTTSIALLPITVALIFKAFQGKQDLSKVEGLLFLICTTLALFWSPSGLVLLPLLGAGLISLRRQIVKPILVGSSCLILLLTIPWLYFFWTEWNVSSFLDQPETTVVNQAELGEMEEAKVVEKRGFRSSEPLGLNLEESKRLFSDSLIRINPLLLILTIPGIALMRPYIRKVFSILMGWLVILAGVLPPLIPQIELDRMFMVLAHLASLPVALAIESLLSRTDLRGRRFFGSVAMSFLLVGLIVSKAIVGNKLEDRYSFASKELAEVVTFIQENLSGPGRLLFSGFVLHDLDRGHIAPLPALTDKPSIAVSPFHDQWSYNQPFPKEVVAAGEKAILDYLALVGADSVAAHERKWREYFLDRPKYFDSIGKAGSFDFFAVKKPADYFYEGSGEVLEQSTSGLTLKLAEGVDTAVVKFRYYPHLESECVISPVDVGFGLEFVRLSECDAGQEVSIRSKGFFTRLFSGSGGAA